jgi:BolA protein
MASEAAVGTGTACSAEAIESALRQALQPTALEVLDESAAHAGHDGASDAGHGTHFRVRIAATAFQGCTRVASHRLVYDALQKFTATGLHALAIEILREPPAR